VPLSSSTPQLPLSSIHNPLRKSVLNLLVSLVLASMAVGWLALRVSGLLGALSTTFTVRKETIDHICDGLDVDEQFLKANTDMSRFEVTTGLMSANSYQSLSKLVGLFGAGSAVVVAATYLLFVLFPKSRCFHLRPSNAIDCWLGYSLHGHDYWIDSQYHRLSKTLSAITPLVS